MMAKAAPQKAADHAQAAAPPAENFMTRILKQREAQRQADASQNLLPVGQGQALHGNPRQQAFAKFAGPAAAERFLISIRFII